MESSMALELYMINSEALTVRAFGRGGSSLSSQSDYLHPFKNSPFRIIHQLIAICVYNKKFLNIYSKDNGTKVERWVFEVIDD
jgi:hypothetical protein